MQTIVVTNMGDDMPDVRVVDGDLRHLDGTALHDSDYERYPTPELRLLARVMFDSEFSEYAFLDPKQPVIRGEFVVIRVFVP